MIETPSVVKPREKLGLWLFKIIAGVLIVFVLGLHFVVNHLIAPEGLLSYAEVIRYYQNPIIPVIEVIFLVLVFGHALVGLRSILLDMNPSDKVLRAADVVLSLVGAAFIVYGIWLAWAIANAPLP